MRNYVIGVDSRLKRRMKRKGSSIGMRCGYLSSGPGRCSMLERRSKSGRSVELLHGGIAAKHNHIAG